MSNNQSSTSTANLQQQQLNNNLNQQSIQSDNDKNSQLKRSGIQTSKDGRITNIPPGMVTDQFGMVGLLSKFK